MSKYLETVYDVKVRPITAYPDQLIDYLIQRFSIAEGSKVLDNGCGRGDFLKAFEKRKMDVSGCDGAKELFRDEVLNDNKESFYGNIDLESGKLPFEDNYFDVVFSKSVIEHIHKPENFLKECLRVLKPHGTVIMMSPDWVTTHYIFYDDFSHVQPYTRTGLKDVMKIFGFQEVCAEMFYQLPVVWKYPIVKIVCKLLQLLGPVKKISRCKFFRFSRELMLLAYGTKGEDNEQS